MTAYILQEKVIKAHLRIELEPTDVLLKKLMGHYQHATISDTLKYLQTVSEQFWRERPQAVLIISEWVNQLAIQLRASPTFGDDIKIRIWTNFLCRVSLDAWLIDKTHKSSGNQILEIMMNVIEDSIYSQFPFVSVPQAQLYPPVFERAPIENRITVPSLPPPPPIEEKFDDDEFTTMQKSTRTLYLPRQDRRGMMIKLKKASSKNDREEASHKGSRSRKKMVTKRRGKEEKDDDEEEEEDDDEEEDEEEESD